MVGASICVVLLASGCGIGSGPTPPPADDTSASASGGDVMISGAYITSPGGASYRAGGTAVAQFQLSDGGSSWDTLTSASTPSATSVQLYQLGGTQKQISVPTGGDQVEASAELIDLGQDLAPGQQVPLTFQFTGAGSLTLQVPVH